MKLEIHQLKYHHNVIMEDTDEKEYQVTILNDELGKIVALSEASNELG